MNQATYDRIVAEVLSGREPEGSGREPEAPPGPSKRDLELMRQIVEESERQRAESVRWINKWTADTKATNALLAEATENWRHTSRELKAMSIQVEQMLKSKAPSAEPWRPSAAFEARSRRLQLGRNPMDRSSSGD